MKTDHSTSVSTTVSVEVRIFPILTPVSDSLPKMLDWVLPYLLSVR